MRGASLADLGSATGSERVLLEIQGLVGVPALVVLHHPLPALWSVNIGDKFY